MHSCGRHAQTATYTTLFSPFFSLFGRAQPRFDNQMAKVYGAPRISTILGIARKLTWDSLVSALHSVHDVAGILFMQQTACQGMIIGP